MYIKSILFKKEWECLEKYYKKKHTHNEANFYYLHLKDLTDEEFKKVMDLVYKKCKYFPNIAEIRELLPSDKEQTMENWTNLKSEPMTKEEEHELEKILSKYKGGMKC